MSDPKKEEEPVESNGNFARGFLRKAFHAAVFAAILAVPVYLAVGERRVSKEKAAERKELFEAAARKAAALERDHPLMVQKATVKAGFPGLKKGSEVYVLTRDGKLPEGDGVQVYAPSADRTDLGRYRRVVQDYLELSKDKGFKFESLQVGCEAIVRHGIEVSLKKKPSFWGANTTGPEQRQKLPQGTKVEILKRQATTSPVQRDYVDALVVVAGQEYTTRVSALALEPVCEKEPARAGAFTWIREQMKDVGKSLKFS